MKTKIISLILAFGVGLSLRAAEEVEVGTVTELIAQLWRLNGTEGNVIKLKAGDYHLPDAAMVTNVGQYANGLSTLHVNKIKLIGLGTMPEDVRLIGAGNLRVINSGHSKTWIENLMITNGNATVKYESQTYSVSGGGFYGGGTVTNCIIVGCRAGSGGGAAVDTVLRKCRIIRNSASSGGGGVNNCSAYGCLIAENVSSADGGGAYSTKVLTDCQIVSNRANAAKVGGGAYFAKAVTNCTFVGNSAGYGGAAGAYSTSDPSDFNLWKCTLVDNTAAKGGAGAYRMTLHDCVVSGNVAQQNGGGGTYQCNLYDSFVSNNVATASSYGGGISLLNGVGLIVSNCLIYANRCEADDADAYGGGVYGSGGSVIDSEITGNCAFSPTGSGKSGHGGGASGARLVSCRIYDNFADGYGGGLRDGEAIGCRIYNNCCELKDGQNAFVTRLEGCDVAGSSVTRGSALNCVFHDIKEAVPVALTNNPYKVGYEKTVQRGVLDGVPNATNCLFVANAFEQQLICGTSGLTEPSSLVNCTIVSNSFRYTFAYFSSAQFPLRVVNCVFFGNRTPGSGGVARDIYPNANTVTSDGVRFSNVMYGVAKDGLDFADWTDSGDRDSIWKFGTNGIASTPKFSGLPGSPFEPKPSSPLVGRGKVMDWMASASDIRGLADGGKYERLRGGMCDLGCYQCWLNPSGFLLLVR